MHPYQSLFLFGKARCYPTRGDQAQLHRSSLQSAAEGASSHHVCNRLRVYLPVGSLAGSLAVIRGGMAPADTALCVGQHARSRTLPTRVALALWFDQLDLQLEGGWVLNWTPRNRLAEGWVAQPPLLRHGRAAEKKMVWSPLLCAQTAALHLHAGVLCQAADET